MNYRDLRDKNDSFSGLAAHTGLPLNITGGTGNPEQVFGEIVTGNYFTVLGARPLVSRVFLPDEDQTPGEKLVCVLGYGEWQKRFGGDPSIVGRTISLNGQQFTVVGIMPKGFKATNAIGMPALWVPYMTYPQTVNGFFLELIRPDSRRGLAFNVTGRLKPGQRVVEYTGGSTGVSLAFICAARPRGASTQRNTRTHRDILNAWCGGQCVCQLFCETGPCRGVGVLRLRHNGEGGPNIVELETGILMTETQKARDEQRRARDQSDREGNLRADKQFAEALLP